MWLVSTRHKVLTSFVVVVSSSAVTNVTIIGVRELVNSLHSLNIITVAYLSTTNGIPSVYQEKELLPEIALTSKDLI